MLRRGHNVLAYQDGTLLGLDFGEVIFVFATEGFMRSRESLETAQADLRAKFALQRRGRGRPSLEIDPQLVYSLARDGHSARAIARYLVCHPDTIRRRFGALLESARTYRARWAWLGFDANLESLQRSDPATLSKEAFRRAPTRARGPGRPKLRIDEDEITKLLLQGYSARGIAIALGCSVRTLQRRFAQLLAATDFRRGGGPALLRLAVQQQNQQVLMCFGRKLAREDARNAERREDEEILRRARGDYE